MFYHGTIPSGCKSFFTNTLVGFKCGQGAEGALLAGSGFRCWAREFVELAKDISQSLLLLVEVDAGTLCANVLEGSQLLTCVGDFGADLGFRCDCIPDGVPDILPRGDKPTGVVSPPVVVPC